MFINLLEEVDYLNFYLIVKSYLSSVVYPFSEILIRIIKPNDLIITERLNASFVLKMTYNEFQKWAQHRINYDLKYTTERDLYSFSFMANPFIVKNSDMSKLKPQYPWKTDILNEIKSAELRNVLNEQKLIEKDKQLEELRLKIKNLEQVLKNKNIQK